ncbi:MAG: hypothetical protein GF364_01325 [Candidatus Lokiarchaeota archaeon]|nr:hypothetical protein [Candidatus Lokiarchaeota archaeon]
MNFIRQKIGSNKKIVFSIIILFIVMLGIANRFIQDDAFISFRYAENLLNGTGLSWNTGADNRVEGYTNFLWVIVIAGIMFAGLDPVLWSHVIGLIIGVGTLFYTFKLALLYSRSEFIALLTLLLVGTNYSFISYMTGGLETQLQTLLFVVSTYGIFRIIMNQAYTNWIFLTGVSIIFSLAILTRPDSLIIVGILYIFFVRNVFEQQKNELKSALLWLTLPSVLIVGLWVVFKINYYGAILPNTYYVKATGNSLEILFRGLLYLWIFFREYSFVVFIILSILLIKQILVNRYDYALGVIVLLWFIYIIKIGGDFMEFRMFVPILPFCMIIISKILFFIAEWKIRLSLLLLLLISSLSHAILFREAYGIESIQMLQAHVTKEDENWKKVGIVLGELFSQSKEPVWIATTAAGAIPYYSKLPTIDMLGLNDRWVAKNGIEFSSRPGHTRTITLEYLLESKVNLVLGPPRVRLRTVSSTRNPQVFFLSTIKESLLPANTRIIEIPLDDMHKIEILYLVQHDFIDHILKKMNFNTYTIQ